jgi:thioredoxin reductase/Fe-S-cluster-containing hydrogenase component 2
MHKYKVAVVGAGPGGLSAAAHAAELELPHILLESTKHHANTIQLYQKGKHVMAEPGILPLRSPMEFDAGTREQVLGAWVQGLEQYKVNIQYGSEVTGIEGERGNFKLTMKDGAVVESEFVILGIGVQGNPRKLPASGAELPVVQYQLDDPDEYKGETVVVVGAGDAAIENAVALSKHNKVFIINRREEFARAKQGNLDLITRSIEQGKVQCFYGTNPARVEESKNGDKPYTFTLATGSGEAQVPCDRIIARLGAVPQRKLVESWGIQFADETPTALPELSQTYESNVPGIYIIGALGGYPLIKQAMNQGYEVVEYLLGNKIKPADHPLLEEAFNILPFSMDVDEVLDLMQERIKMFSEINPLLFREFMLDSQVLSPRQGETIYKKNDYTSTFYTILDGEAHIQLEDKDKRTLGPGQFFGEQSLISGRRRDATVIAGEGCLLVETPRRTMVKLINSNESIRRGIDEIFIGRAIQASFAPNTPTEELRDVVQAAQLNSFKAGDTIYQEGDEGDTLHLVRVGSLTLSREIAGREIVLSYVPAGNYVGELGLIGNRKRLDTARASVRTETISLDSKSFLSLLEKEPELKDQVQEQVRERLKREAAMAAQPESGDVISFFMQQGLGEGTDVLIIDESLCVGCNNCEKACAETHSGTSRLNREAGASFAYMHVPISCRHCEHPHCMKDCPPDALRRAPNGEVYIEDSCIGCGNCVNNCPYGVIHLAYKPPKKPGLLSWMLFGAGPGPGEDTTATHGPNDLKKAVKCDMCKDLPGGSACVRACPTGAAIRINPEQFVDFVKIV